ncbi:MAG: hypothetical protein IKN10_05420 [Muribaculaceae bacterium]|nr:hypothetical protein [Muribaculaceae bacterium]
MMAFAILPTGGRTPSFNSFNSQTFKIFAALRLSVGLRVRMPFVFIVFLFGGLAWGMNPVFADYTAKSERKRGIYGEYYLSLYFYYIILFNYEENIDDFADGIDGEPRFDGYRL